MHSLAVHPGEHQYISALIILNDRGHEAILTEDDAVELAELVHDHGTVSYDPNIRPALMGSPEAVRDRIETLVGLSDLVKVSDEDLDWLYGDIELADVIRDWTSQSLSPRTVPAPDVPGGTVFFRTGGAWDCVVAAAVLAEGRLHPVIVFKNPVALWQCAREPLRDGQLERHDWSWLRRQIMLHNPGLDGLLQEIEDRAAT